MSAFDPKADISMRRLSLVLGLDADSVASNTVKHQP